MTGEVVAAASQPEGRDSFPMRAGCAREGRLPEWLVVATPTLRHFGQRINTVLVGGWAEANCRYCVDHKRRIVTVRTTRSIEKGQQLLAYYGASYVRSLRAKLRARGEEDEQEAEERRAARLKAQSRDSGGQFTASAWRSCPFCPARRLRGDAALASHLNICKARRLQQRRGR